MKRNCTSYPAWADARLRELHAEYLERPESERRLYAYHHWLVRALLSDPEFGFWGPDGSRGLLVYHGVGTGKTRLMVAVALALLAAPAGLRRRRVIVVAEKSLQANFHETLRGVVAALNPGETGEALEARLAETRRAFRTLSLIHI